MDKAELKQAIADGLRCQSCYELATDIHRPDAQQGYIKGNMVPLCVPCHQAIHGNEAKLSDLKLLTRLYYEQQGSRKRIANRVRAYGALDIPVPMAESALDDTKAMEETLKRYVIQLLKGNGIYNAWLKHVTGIGPMLGASLISEMGSAERFRCVSSLWHYAGMHVVEGEAPRRKRGQKANWNAALRMTCWKVASQFVKTNGCLGRQLYDQYKNYYIERDGPEPKWQPHNRALRRVAKDFLRCLWAAWMQAENLPVTEARKGTWPMPGDWIDGKR